MNDLKPDFSAAIAWRNGPDTGNSSVALVSFLMGWPNGGTDYPRDPDDFGRCYRALQAMPELRARIGEAAALGAEWRRLVEHWDELERMYDEEAPSGRAPKMYQRMRYLTRWLCEDCGAETNSKFGGVAICRECRGL